jgi:hypothetical protein
MKECLVERQGQLEAELARYQLVEGKVEVERKVVLRGLGCGCCISGVSEPSMA